LRRDYILGRRLIYAIFDAVAKRLLDEAVFAAVETDYTDSASRTQAVWGNSQKLSQASEFVIDQYSQGLKRTCGRV